PPGRVPPAGARTAARTGEIGGRGRVATIAQPGNQLLPGQFGLEGNADAITVDPAHLAGERTQPLGRDRDLLAARGRIRRLDADPALRDVAGRDELGARGTLDQRRSANLDARHAPSLARLVGEIAGEDRQHVDRLVEAQPDLEPAAPGDRAVEMGAVVEFELQPLALVDRQVDMDHRAARADLADLADLPDAAHNQRAGLQRGVALGEQIRVERGYITGQRVDGIQHRPASPQTRDLNRPASRAGNPRIV